MKFLVTILVLRFLTGLMSNREEDNNAGNTNPGNGKVLHPAEHAIR
ncbi:MAG: hypothetical protein HZA79_00460 [Sphingobacteriales bacterium]|nr:hypothetical protein [Sphingobacteriales bacterium]